MEWIVEDPLLALFLLTLISSGVLLLILWTILPFAVSGIKSRMDTMIEHMESMNAKQELLVRFVRELVHMGEIPQERPEQYMEEGREDRHSEEKEIA